MRFGLPAQVLSSVLLLAAFPHFASVPAGTAPALLVNRVPRLVNLLWDGLDWTEALVDL